VPSVTTRTWHLPQSTSRVPTMLAVKATRVETAGGDVTTIFILTSGVLFAVAAAGIVWIRVAAAEYRHRWTLPRQIPRADYRYR
jgi:hypothetical protein